MKKLSDTGFFEEPDGWGNPQLSKPDFGNKKIMA